MSVFLVVLTWWFMSSTFPSKQIDLFSLLTGPLLLLPGSFIPWKHSSLPLCRWNYHNLHENNRCKPIRGRVWQGVPCKKSTGIHNNASSEAKGTNCNNKYLSVPEIIDKHTRNMKTKVCFFYHRLVYNLSLCSSAAVLRVVCWHLAAARW